MANNEAVLILGKLGEILPYIYRQTNPSKPLDLERLKEWRGKAADAKIHFAMKL
jgi:hypothetical protein